MPEDGAFIFVKPVGVHERKGRRKFGRAFVMIDDDHIDAGGLGHLHRFECLRAAVDGNDQAGTALCKLHKRFARRAITLHQPIGDIGSGFQPKIAQQTYQQRCRRGPVNIIISKDRYLFA